MSYSEHGLWELWDPASCPGTPRKGPVRHPGPTPLCPVNLRGGGEACVCHRILSAGWLFSPGSTAHVAAQGLVQRQVWLLRLTEPQTLPLGSGHFGGRSDRQEYISAGFGSPRNAQLFSPIGWDDVPTR